MAKIWANGVHRDATQAELDAIAPVPVEDIRGQMSVSFVDLMGKLVQLNQITLQEARGWLKGTLPSNIEAAIDALPTLEAQAQAESEARRDTVIRRNGQLIAALQTALGATDAQVDNFFGG